MSDAIRTNNELQYVVDGTADDGTLQGDGEFAPFYVFCPPEQRNVAGPFETRYDAEIAMSKLAR